MARLEDVQAEVLEWVEATWDPEGTVRTWWRRLAEAGYAAPMLPVALGGRGYDRDLAMAVHAALGDREVVGPPAGMGLQVIAPTLAAHGTEEQQRRFVPSILDGTEAWCQLFSEPGAGSDLAGLHTRARADGDGFVISGQKVWTSYGQDATWGLLIARTDPGVGKRQGLSCFALPMDLPGVDLRPLREMTGRSVFNEVFLDEVRVGADLLIGDLGAGWRVASTTLASERASIGSTMAATSRLGSAHPGPLAGNLDRRVGDLVGQRTEGAGSLDGFSPSRLAALARDRGVATDPQVRQGLAELHTLSEIGRWSVMRAKAGRGTAVDGNLAKLLMSHRIRRARDVAGLVLGPGGMLWGPQAPTDGVVQELTVYSPAPAIFGGTDQIQRTIVGERGLGLPREPDALWGLPYCELPKGGAASGGRVT